MKASARATLCYMLHGDTAPPAQRGKAPNVRPMSVVANRLDGSRCHCMDVGLDLGHIVLDGKPVSPKSGAAPNFRLMYVVAKRLHGSRCHLV